MLKKPMNTATIALGVAAVVLAAFSALSQNDPGNGTNFPPPEWGTNQPPPPPPDWGSNAPRPGENLPSAWTNRPPAWTNDFRGTRWWTNGVAYTNSPGKWTKQTGRTVPRKPAPSTTTPLPPDVQTVVQQFQRNRDQLMSRLKGLSDDQRQAYLEELGRLREQQREQLNQLRRQAKEQAEAMQSEFSNPRDRMTKEGSSSGTSSSSGTRGRQRR